MSIAHPASFTHTKAGRALNVRVTFIPALTPPGDGDIPRSLSGRSCAPRPESAASPRPSIVAALRPPCHRTPCPIDSTSSRSVPGSAGPLTQFLAVLSKYDLSNTTRNSEYTRTTAEIRPVLYLA